MSRIKRCFRKQLVSHWMFVCLILATMLMYTGCRPTRVRSDVDKTLIDVDKSDNKEEPPLRIFTLGNSTLVQDYQLAYPDEELEVVPISMMNLQGSLEDRILDTIQRVGEPDIIIDTNSGLGLSYWNEIEMIADISYYFDLDDTFDPDEYYPGAETVGRSGEMMYALPLGLQVNYMTVHDEAWKESNFAALPENYTAFELLCAMEAELDYWMEQDKEDYRWVFQGDAYDIASWLWDSGALQITANGVTVDREILKLLVDGERKCGKNINEYTQIKGGISVIRDPREGNYCAVGWSECIAPQIGLLYYQSMNQVLMDQNIHVLWIPLKQVEKNGKPHSQYAAEVAAWGMVGVHSENPEKAYQTIRKMMDIPLHGYAQPDSMNSTYMPFSINRQEALNMIETANQEYIPSFIVDYEEVGNVVQKQPLSDELRREMETMLNQIVMIYATDSIIETKIYDAFIPYLLDEEVNYDLVYAKVLEAVQGYAE